MNIPAPRQAKNQYKLDDIGVGESKDFGAYSKKLANCLSSACKYYRDTKNPEAVFKQRMEEIKGKMIMRLYREN